MLLQYHNKAGLLPGAQVVVVENANFSSSAFFSKMMRFVLVVANYAKIVLA